MKKGLWKTIFAILVLTLPAVSYGQLITIAISGQIYSVSDQYGHLENKIHVGDTITGTYTYDSATSISGPAGYEWHGTPAGISLDISSFNFRTDPSNVYLGLGVVNNDLSGYDYYGLVSYHNLPLSSGTLVSYISWQLNDPTGTALSSDALPLTAPDLSKWYGNGLSITTDRTFTISARVTSAVPEPATMFLLGFGIALARKRFSK